MYHYLLGLTITKKNDWWTLNVSADQILQDLRGKLIDKRNIREGKSHSSDRLDEPERKKLKRERKEREEKEKKEEVPPNETPKERAERVEREERKAKLLEASEL